MADDINVILSEDNDLVRAKAWWQANGKAIIAGIVLGLVVVVGYNYRQSYNQSQGEQASQLFAQVQQLNATARTEAAQDLFTNYANSAYAANAALLLAADSVAKKDMDTAEKHLRWAHEHVESIPIRHIAQTRLASVLLEQGQAAKVLNLLNPVDYGTFAARYFELMGDAYVATGDFDAARNMYKESLQLFTTNAESITTNNFVKFKLDNLGN